MSFSPDKVSQRKVLPASDSNESAKDNIKPIGTPNGGKPSLIRRNSLMRQANAFKYMYALEQMKVQSEEDVDTLEDIRITIKKYMSNSAVGAIYENLIILISIASAIVYIHTTYALDKHNRYQNQRPVIDAIDFVFVFIFAFDWILNFFLADSKVYYFWSFFSWVDILIIISMLATRDEELPWLNPVNSFYIGMMYSFFVFRPVRILRSLRCYTKFSGIVDPVDRYASQMGIFAAVFILFFSAVMQILERHAQALPFHTWMYYCSVTVATVGYGDITPKTAAGRVLAMTIIGCAVISVPVATNELIEKMKLQSVYMRSVYTAKSRNAKHIIICGDLSSTSLADFFGELFHDDHENDGLNAVILLPKPPTVELILLMQSAEYFLSLTYLEGSALNDQDLRRAKAETASAIFVMTNKFSPNPDEEDAKSILLNFSIKRYLQAFYRPRILYCVQLLKPENRRHLTKSTTNEIDDSDIVICLNEVKMGAMAQALLYPGANILLMNLLTSFSDDGIDVDESRLTVEEIPMSDTTEETVRNSPKAWFDEYSRGCDWEIYVTKLSRVFDNAKFSELSYALYEKKGVLLFALQLKDKKVAGSSRLVLNPGSFVIPSQDEYDIQAFVIAKNTATSDLSFAEEAPVHNEHTALQLMSRNFGSVAYIMKSAADNVMERRKSSLKDVNKLRTAVIVNKLDAVGEDEEEETSQTVKKESRWKTLKRSALLERRIKSDSFQEVVHRYEDEHFNTNYYVRKTPIKLEDVTIKKDVTTEVPAINNHIIVIARSLRNVFDLLRPLRSKHLGPMKYIVILHPFEIPLDVWRRISVLDGLLFVRGSSLEDVNLKRAGIFRASTVIVVADGAYEQESGDQTNSSENLVDSDAIFTYQHVKRLNPQCHVIVEIVNQSNIGYLEDHSNPSLVNDPKFSPQFAAGVLFATGLLDSIVCQAYYNPEIVKVINKMIAGVDQIERSQLMLRAAEELGHVDKSNSSDESSSSSESENEGGDADEEEQSNSGRNRSRSWSGSGKEDPKQRKNSEVTTGTNNSKSKKGSKKKKKEDLPQELLLHKSRRKLLKIPNSCLYQINIPENLEKKTYGALFQLLAAQGIIPLGIYRGVLSMGIGPKANRMPYVFTNPPQETELYACDLIFVLSTKPERANSSKLEIKDWLANIQMQKSKNDESGGTPTNRNPRATRSTQIITGAKRETVLPGEKNDGEETYDVSYKKLEEKFKNFTAHLDQKLVSIIESMEKVLEDGNNGVPPFISSPAALTSARSYTFDEATMVSGTTNGNSLEVENSNSGRCSMSSHLLGSASEERKEDDQSTGRFMFINADNTGNTPTNPFNPLLFPRKSSLKKRMSNPTVPAISEEPHSSGQSTAHSEDDEGENKSAEQRNSATNKETAQAFVSRISNDLVSTNGTASQSPEKSQLGRGSRQTMTLPSQPYGNAVIEAKAAVENKLLASVPSRTGRQTMMANKLVKPAEFIENGKLEKAISNISMDFSVNENDPIREGEKEGDEEEEIIDTSPLEPIKFQVQEERKRIDSEELEIERSGALHNEDRARESSGKSYEGRSNRSSIISISGDSLPGPKLTSVSPLPLDRLAKVKSLTDFKDTKSGKIRSTIIRPNQDNVLTDSSHNNKQETKNN